MVRGHWSLLLATALSLAIGGVLATGCAKPANNTADKKDGDKKDGKTREADPVPQAPKKSTPKPDADEPATKPAEKKPAEKPTEDAGAGGDVVPKLPGGDKPEAKTEVAAAGGDKPAGGTAEFPGKAAAYAPAADLAHAMDYYLTTLKESVESDEKYKDDEGRFSKDVSTVAVVSLVLGMHDEDNKYKANAGKMLQAAQSLEGAKDYAAAKKGVEALVAAAEKGEGTAKELKWEKVTSLPELMKAVPQINTRLKGAIRPNTLERKAKDSQGHAAVIAAIGQASYSDLTEAKTPENVDKWHGYCLQMRAAAAEVNDAIRKRDKEALGSAVERLTKSCDDCHAVFHPKELEKK